MMVRLSDSEIDLATLPLLFQKLKEGTGKDLLRKE